MDDKSKIEKIVKDAKDLLNIFEDIKNKADVNNSSCLFKIERLTIAKNILPYMELRDIINFRSTCKDINASVSSTVAMVSYYKTAAHNKKSSNPDLSKILLKPFEELSDPDDIKIELESLKKIRDFLTKKLFQSESILKIYKNDMEYLKAELLSQTEITERLNETLASTRDELEEAKKHSMQLKQKLDDTTKKFDESNSIHMKKNEDLSKTVDDLKNEKLILTNGILKLKKISDDLKKKNYDKGEALKSIRNFFLTSTLFKIKNISDFEDNYQKSKNEKGDN